MTRINTCKPLAWDKITAIHAMIMYNKGKLLNVLYIAGIIAVYYKNMGKHEITSVWQTRACSYYRNVYTIFSYYSYTLTDTFQFGLVNLKSV